MTTTLDAAAIELAESLSVDAVPAKLRCASCNKLAINAVKLPCCDQSICEPCSLDLPDTCPICGHSPLSAADCKPNKSLRMTVKAFIKSEEKKRSKEAESRAPPPVEITPAFAAPVETAVEVATASDGELAASGAVAQTGDDNDAPTGSVVEDMSISMNDAVQGEAITDSAPAAVPEEDDDEDDDDDVVITTERPEEEKEQLAEVNNETEDTQQEKQQGQVQQSYQSNMQQQGFAGDQNQPFGGMDFGGNFNPMMAMQAGMGMPNFGMGMPNMMGMPGMNIDPSMMFGGGFGGMGGVNDMNMNMMAMGMGMGTNGMGNFGSMPGMGMNGGQNFFPANAGGGGYNSQQNFGSHMNQNFNPNRGYGGNRSYNRGFGRGTGRQFHGRGGRGGGWQTQGPYNQGPQQNFSAVNQPYRQQQQQDRQASRGRDDETFVAGAARGTSRASPSYEPMGTPSGAETDAGQQQDAAARERSADATNREIEDADVTGIGAADEPRNGTAGTTENLAAEDGNAEGIEADSNATGITTEKTSVEVETEPAGQPDSFVGVDPFESLDATHEQNSEHNHDFATHNRNTSRAPHAGYNGPNGAYGNGLAPAQIDIVPAAAPPINAPTGPKAMRAGLPNSGWYSRAQQAMPAAASPLRTQVSNQNGRGSQARSRSHSVSSTRSASRSQRHSKRKAQDLDDESSDSYERRKARERRKRKEREGRYTDEVDEHSSSTKHHSRSTSKDGERSKRRHRDADDGHRSSRSRRNRSGDRRRHRDRTASPDKDDDINGDDYDSSRRKGETRGQEDEPNEDNRARSKSHRHSRRDDGHATQDRSHESSRHGRSSREERDRRRDRHAERPVAVSDAPEEEFEFKIKGKSASMKQSNGTSMGPPVTFGKDRSDRRSSHSDFTPATPNPDPYAADRESHRKKREAEQQKKLEGRRQSSHSLGKHSRDDDDQDIPTGPKGDGGESGKRARKDMRKHSAKYEGEVGNGYGEDAHWR